MRIRAKTLPYLILLAIAGGAGTFAALMAPNIFSAFKPFMGRGKRSNAERERIRSALRRLEKRRLISLDWNDKSAELKVSAEGKRYPKRYEFEAFALPRAEKWDKTWRLIIFDIPEQFVKARHALQFKLKKLGCFALQRSVWIYPYDCRDEIDFVAEFFGVRKFVQFIETRDLDRAEGKARQYFSLL